MESGAKRGAQYRGVRLCSRSGCRNIASRTLIYVYNESTAVLGPLATFAEPHTYDLCEVHTSRLSVPKGWSIINKVQENAPVGPSEDDLMAIADAVRSAGKKVDNLELAPVATFEKLNSHELGRRGHLRAIPN
jgi:hypothetical protein